MSIKSINDFREAKKNGIPISVITCYDFAFARIIDECEIDVILVGDSVGMVQAGYENTLPVSLDHIIYHTANVRRGAPERFIIADLPFMSYHVSIEDTLRNCGRIMKESEANSVKLEGGRHFKNAVEAIAGASIPVCGHLGLTPQSIHKLGGYSVQGRGDQKKIILEDAKILEEAGVFAIVLEKVPEELAREISESVSVPTIGIGAGRYCDGQVLVLNDMLGMDAGFNPKFLKKYADLHEICKTALQTYHFEVREKKFPAAENAYS